MRHNKPLGKTVIYRLSYAQHAQKQTLYICLRTENKTQSSHLQRELTPQINIMQNSVDIFFIIYCVLILGFPVIVYRGILPHPESKRIGIVNIHK